MNIIKIVTAHLKDNGFDGLVNTDGQCGCLLGDLVPCDGNFGSCEPGYRGASEDYPGEWEVYRTKEAAAKSIEEFKKYGAHKEGD